MQRVFTRKEKEEWENENLSKRACKSSDVQYKANRFKDEEPDFYRTEFQRDVSRILYSDPFRRLRTKNQVIYNDLDQHNRTRLTHTYEVAHLSRQVARALYLNEDLVEAIALGHDLGHTPFGHAGERALDKCMNDKGGFSHNVQSVWIVERVSRLNLTYATREGILKHTDVTTDTSEIQHLNPKKMGTLEAQIVNKCDTLAYLKHDIDDGIRNGMLEMEDVKKIWREIINEDFENWYSFFINDLVSNSFDKKQISYSADTQPIFKKFKKCINGRLLENKRVVKADNDAEEKVTEMFNMLLRHNQLIPDIAHNDWKTKNFGVERTICDYIQWLGDNNFDTVLENMKEKV